MVQNFWTETEFLYHDIAVFQNFWNSIGDDVC
jgi:hypothetical protein